jgi:hypothetical protein
MWQYEDTRVEAENRDLSRLISNLSRLETTIPVLATRNLPCLVFESSNMFLTHT